MLASSAIPMKASEMLLASPISSPVRVSFASQGACAKATDGHKLSDSTQANSDA